MSKTDSITKKIIWPEGGTYVVAVSGGVDSVALLDLMVANNKNNQWQLVIAHFDHGIRVDSIKDLEFVHGLAAKYQLPFEAAQVELGQDASEAAARQARYHFLEIIKAKHKAAGIVTAHHLDDKLETALLNLERGTGRQGLTPFRRNRAIVRPLRNVYKQELVAYAKAQALEWMNDSTNYDLRYRRNYVRHVMVPLLEADQADFKKHLAKLIRQLEFDNYQLDQDLADIKAKIGNPTKNGLVLQRGALIMMSQRLAQEFLRYSIDELQPGLDIPALQIKRLVQFVKTARPGATLQMSKQLQAQSGYDRVTLTYSSRQA